MGNEYDPLFELNKGVGQFLQGDRDAATRSLRNALKQIQTPEGRFDLWGATYLLVLESTDRKVWFCEGLPIDAVILINLWKMGDLARNELEAGLKKNHPDNAEAWLAMFPTI